ncbi:hypothetical protein M0802_004546 [Mischocyttarus mexicanus]|nr:hypothetical protein M0802_004546 [Mischocyttarus mexicanus]
MQGLLSNTLSINSSMQLQCETILNNSQKLSKIRTITKYCLKKNRVEEIKRGKGVTELKVEKKEREDNNEKIDDRRVVRRKEERGLVEKSNGASNNGALQAEKLLNSEGRELRRALFSLKQIFQEDKDLVHEFVQNDGLACLIKVGSEADQNYQNYILRALGQVMLYVDGMNGVIEHGQTVQWLYTLIASRFRLVVKTALKLLLVFVEYVETNSLLLVRAVRSVDTSRGMIPWTNVMKLLKDYDAADTELLIYATTLVNKCLNGIPDQDTYYDQVDCLEEQGIEGIIQRYMSKQGTDLDLLRQFQIYEAVLHHEDGNDRGSPIRQLDDNIRKTLRNRKSLVDSHERRKSRRHSTGTSPLSMSLNARLSPRSNHSLGLSSLNNTLNSSLPDDDDESSSSQSSQGHLGEVQLNGSYKENKGDPY